MDESGLESGAMARRCVGLEGSDAWHADVFGGQGEEALQLSTAKNRCTLALCEFPEAPRAAGLLALQAP